VLLIEAQPACRKRAAGGELLSVADAWVYMLRCADGSLYTGWTNDLEKRLEAHSAGTGSRYTRSRLPVELAASFEMEDRSAAQREEVRIKRLSRADKLALIA
jgi:putative endonuclease